MAADDVIPPRYQKSKWVDYVVKTFIVLPILFVCFIYQLLGKVHENL